MELHAQPPWCSLMCVAPSTGCVLNSVHVVPLPTRSCRWSNSCLGPVAGGSGLAQDSLRRVVATVWRFCDTASRLLYSPPQSHVPYTLPFGSFSVADGAGGCWVGRTHLPPPLPPTHLVSGGPLLVEAGFRLKAEVVSQGLNTALVPICYLDKWLFANISLGMEW